MDDFARRDPAWARSIATFLNLWRTDLETLAQMARAYTTALDRGAPNIHPSERYGDSAGMQQTNGHRPV